MYPTRLYWADEYDDLSAGYAATRYAWIGGVSALITIKHCWAPELSSFNEDVESYAK